MEENGAPQGDISELANLAAEENGIQFSDEEQQTTTPAEETSTATESTTEVTEETQTNNQTETEIPAFDWSTILKPEVPVVEQPKPDESGSIDIDALTSHLTSKIKNELRAEERLQAELSRQQTAAEEILPQLKTNKGLAQLVRDAAVAATYEGKPLDIVSAAQAIADELGVAQSTGANQARTTIEEIDNASLGGSATGPSAEESRIKSLESRVNNGDGEALEEIVDMWVKDGII